MADFRSALPICCAKLWAWSPGAVTPFGAINDTQGRVTVVLDAPMMEHETLNYHPLVNTMTTSINRDDLVKFLEFDRPYAPNRAGFRSRLEPALMIALASGITHLIRQGPFIFRLFEDG